MWTISEKASKLLEQGLSKEEVVDKLKNDGDSICSFEINGKKTYWSIGFGLGEMVYRCVFEEKSYYAGERVCAEQMYYLLKRLR